MDAIASESKTTGTRNPPPQQTTSLPSTADSVTDDNEMEMSPINRKKDDFFLLEELGEGSYSTVYLASERTTSRKFAMKVCFKQKIVREKKIQQIFRERDVLRLLSTSEHSNPFIVRLYCTFQDQDCLYFVLTLASRKDLAHRLKILGSRFSIEQCRFVMAELWIALSHIHALRIVHRDVKPENILIRNNGHIILSDFGCSKRLESSADPANETIVVAEDQPTSTAGAVHSTSSGKRRCSFVGTAQYVSPEVLNGQETTAACDWWAFGVILFELLAGRRPFCGESEYLLYRQILKLAYAFPDEFPSEEGRLLVQQLLAFDPTQRLGSEMLGGPEAISQHPFFAGMPWAELDRQKSPLFPTIDEPES